MRTGSLRRIIFGLDRENMAGSITQLHDLHRKVIPTANPFVGEMVDTRNENAFLGLR